MHRSEIWIGLKLRIIWMKKGGIPTIPNLIDMAKENGVRLIACQMTLDVLGIKKEEVLDGLEPGEKVIVSSYQNYADHDKLMLKYNR